MADTQPKSQTLMERLKAGKEEFKEFKSGTWGSAMWVLAGVLVASIILTLFLWFLHTDIFTANHTFGELGFFASGGGFPFFLMILLIMVGSSLSLALAMGKNMTSMIVAAVSVLVIFGLAWVAISDVKANGNNANSNFVMWATLLVILSFIFPIVGFYMMYSEVEKVKKATPGDVKTIDQMEEHYKYVKVGAGVGIIGAIGLAVAKYKMYKILYPTV